MAVLRKQYFTILNGKINQSIANTPVLGAWVIDFQKYRSTFTTLDEDLLFDYISLLPKAGESFKGIIAIDNNFQYIYVSALDAFNYIGNKTDPSQDTKKSIAFIRCSISKTQPASGLNFKIKGVDGFYYLVPNKKTDGYWVVDNYLISDLDDYDSKVATFTVLGDNIITAKVGSDQPKIVQVLNIRDSKSTISISPDKTIVLNYNDSDGNKQVIQPRSSKSGVTAVLVQGSSGTIKFLNIYLKSFKDFLISNLNTEREIRYFKNNTVDPVIIPTTEASNTSTNPLDIKSPTAIELLPIIDNENIIFENVKASTDNFTVKNGSFTNQLSPLYDYMIDDQSNFSNVSGNIYQSRNPIDIVFTTISSKGITYNIQQLIKKYICINETLVERGYNNIGLEGQTTTMFDVIDLKVITDNTNYSIIMAVNNEYDNSSGSDQFMSRLPVGYLLLRYNRGSDTIEYMKNDSVVLPIFPKAPAYDKTDLFYSAAEVEFRVDGSISGSEVICLTQNESGYYKTNLMAIYCSVVVNEGSPNLLIKTERSGINTDIIMQ